MYHGFADDQHVDYATMIWNDLINVVNAKHRASKARSFMPFMRFTQVIIRHCMRQTPEIQRHDNLPKCPRNEMQYIMSHMDDPEVAILPITLSILKSVGRTDVDVQEYISPHYPDYERTSSPDHQSSKESASSDSAEDESSNDEDYEGSDNDSDDESGSPDAPDEALSPNPSQSPKDERHTKIRHDPALTQPQPIPAQPSAPLTQTPSESLSLQSLPLNIITPTPTHSPTPP